MENDELNKWHERYLGLCDSISSWSKDPSSQIGCVIVGRNGQILSQGYNGFARGIKDTIERYDVRSLKYRLVVHAEANAMMKVAKSTHDSNGATLYITLSPCKHCSKNILQAGIRRVVYNKAYKDSSGLDFLKKSGILLEHIPDLKEE